METANAFIEKALLCKSMNQEIEMRTTFSEIEFKRLLSHFKERYDLTEEVYESHIHGHFRCQIHGDSARCMQKKIKNSKKCTHMGRDWKLVHAFEVSIADTPMIGVIVCRRIHRWSLVHSTWNVCLSIVHQSTKDINSVGCCSNECGVFQKFEVEIELIGTSADMTALEYLLDFICV